MKAANDNDNNLWGAVAQSPGRLKLMLRTSRSHAVHRAAVHMLQRSFTEA